MDGPTLSVDRPPFFDPKKVQTRILMSGNDDSELWRIEMALFRSPDRSYLMCTCSKFQLKSWCEHVTSWYTKNLDAEENCDVNTRIGYKPIITIFIDPWLLVQTVLVPVDNDGVSHGLHAVHCVWGKMSDNSQGVNMEGGENIGFIDPMREGRGTIRKLFLEWIPSQFYADLACTSQWHNGSPTLTERVEQLSLDGEDKYVERTRRELICDAYSILNSKICYKCLAVSPF